MFEHRSRYPTPPTPGSGPDAPCGQPRARIQRIQSAVSAPEKLTAYARALATLLPDVAPLQVALREAGRADPGCARAWSDLVARRAANMLLLARDLRRTGQLRGDLDDQQVADFLWATNSTEYFLLLDQRGWTPQQFGAHLADLWTRMLLDPNAAVLPSESDGEELMRGSAGEQWACSAASSLGSIGCGTAAGSDRAPAHRAPATRLAAV